MNRARGWLPILVMMLALVGFAFEVGMARASAPEAPNPSRAQAYRAGPLEQRAPASPPEWPGHAEELLALAVLTAILYGFRFSGLAEQGREKHSETQAHSGAPRAVRR